MHTSIRPFLFCLGLLFLAPMAMAGDGLVFGPQTFERTMGTSDVYEVPFDAEAGAYVLYVRNGDCEATRVESATITLNGSTVLSGTDLEETPGGARRPVELAAGENLLEVEVVGPAGSFVTIAIGDSHRPPVFVHGRLILAWGRHDSERALALALKNGSPRAPRAVRVVFFGPAGHVTAVSERFVLPPHGSIAALVDDVIANGAWIGGSVEVFFAGPGTARLFGQARQIDALGRSETIPLEAAGRHVFRGRPEPDAAAARFAPRR